jgi:hypothetical protein
MAHEACNTREIFDRQFKVRRSRFQNPRPYHSRHTSRSQFHGLVRLSYVEEHSFCAKHIRRRASAYSVGGPSISRRPLYVFRQPVRKYWLTEVRTSLPRMLLHTRTGSNKVDMARMWPGPSECLDQDIDVLSPRQNHSTGERTSHYFSVFSFSCSQSLLFCIFLVDIKLALGNNPHLFTAFPLEPSWR